ncbi:flagellar motor switch protein FliG [Desulfovibrionales bacterium]
MAEQHGSKLSGPQKTAILMLVMGETFTVEIFKRLDRTEILAISRAIMDLPIIPKAQVEEVVREYHRLLITGQELLAGGEETVKHMLVKALDSGTAKCIMDALDIDIGPAPFRELKNVSPRILAQILHNEHPQTLALIIGHLYLDQAAQLLSNLPASVRSVVLMRLARLEAVPEEMLLEVNKVLQSQLIAMGDKKSKKVGGVQSVAEILNAMDRATEEEVLLKIEKESSQMADEIRNFMFVFDDIQGLDDRSIRELLKKISNKDLVLALKGATEKLQAKFFLNLSKRAATIIKEDLEIMGPVRLSDVEEAQQNIVKTARRLDVEGRIIIRRGLGDVFI